VTNFKVTKNGRGRNFFRMAFWSQTTPPYRNKQMNPAQTSNSMRSV
jgi:hypothetical protein